MALQTASTLYPNNGTVIDTDTSIDVRLLTDTSDTSDINQSVRWTHTQDGQNRTFDPDNTVVTTIADPLTFQGEGWALRLTEDMTPGDDTNCNAVLTAGTITVPVDARCNMNGGTNIGGTTTFTMKVSLWDYDPDTNTGTVIATGTQNQSWNTGVGGNNNTFLTTDVSVNLASNYEFPQEHILFLQIGASGNSLPNATLGTTNFDLTLRIQNTTNTRVEFDSGQGLAQVCFFTGTSAGSATANGTLAPVFPTTGTSNGTSTVSGLLEAEKETTGTASGAATASGALTSVKETAGTAAGAGVASGVPAIVVPTTGTVNVSVGGGGDTIVVKKPVYIFSS